MQYICATRNALFLGFPPFIAQTIVCATTPLIKAWRYNYVSCLSHQGLCFQAMLELLLGNQASVVSAKLPRNNEWVFSSKRSGRLQSPTKAFQRMMDDAEINHLTLHGLRRSFSTLAEWVEAPAGIIAQIQGHQPSAINLNSEARSHTATVRPRHLITY